MSKLNNKIDTIIHNSVIYGVDIHDSFKDTELDDQSSNVVTNSAITTELKRYLKKEEQLQPQRDWSEGDGTRYVYSETPKEGGWGSKVIPNIRSLITQIGGKLKLKWWLWGDNDEKYVVGEEIPVASSLSDGAMSKEDKTKLDNMAATGSLSNLKTETKTNLVESINEVFEVASKIKDASLSFQNYSEAFAHVINKDTTDLYVGGNIFIETINVPDLWISKKYTGWVSYTYINDSVVVSQLKLGPIRVGYYDVSALETQKIDLSEYRVKNADPNDFAIGTGGVLYSKSGYRIVNTYNDLLSIDPQYLRDGCKANISSTNKTVTYDSGTETWYYDSLQEGPGGVSVDLGSTSEGKSFEVPNYFKVGYNSNTGRSFVKMSAQDVRMESPYDSIISVGSSAIDPDGETYIRLNPSEIDIQSCPTLGSGTINIGSGTGVTNLMGDRICIGTESMYTNNVCVFGSYINIGTDFYDSTTEELRAAARNIINLSVGSNMVSLGTRRGVEIIGSPGITLYGNLNYGDVAMASVVLGSTIEFISSPTGVSLSHYGIDFNVRSRALPVCTSGTAGIMTADMYSRYEAGSSLKFKIGTSPTINSAVTLGQIPTSTRYALAEIVSCTSPRDYLYGETQQPPTTESKLYGSLDKLFTLMSRRYIFLDGSDYFFPALREISDLDCSEATSMYSTFNLSPVQVISKVLNTSRCKRFGLIFAGSRLRHLEGLDLSAINGDSVAYPAKWYEEVNDPSSELPDSLKQSTDLHPLLCAFWKVPLLDSFPIFCGLNISLDETTFFNTVTISWLSSRFLSFLQNLGKAKYRLYESESGLWDGKKGVIQFSDSVFETISDNYSSSAVINQAVAEAFYYKDWIISDSKRENFIIPS